ncbi:MAG: hypothetical protein CVU89_10245 [Firmicutes bacterium HGW-Firmicutes-14]|nr:MAG: hypothetical protein CVU89_10245 [Firmicutes bacterium HGW-Firmicutes-14]
MEPEPRMADLVEVICQKYGDEFRHKIFSREGTLKSTAWFILNGIKLAEDPLSTKLKNGDILILSSPLLVGG